MRLIEITNDQGRQIHVVTSRIVSVWAPQPTGSDHDEGLLVLDGMPSPILLAPGEAARLIALLMDD